MKKTVLFCTALFAFSANAHNVWFEPVANQAHHYVMKFGHEQTETYPESKIKSIQQADANGKITEAKYQYNNGEAVIDVPNASLIFAKFDNGVWSKLPSGRYVEKTKQEEPTAVESINPVKFGKAILKWNKQALAKHDVAYELVPLSQPKAGKALDILVLHNGKPVKGIKVGLGEDQPFNLSNEKGIASFTPSKGENKVWAEFDESVTDKTQYDSRSIEYMLTFDAQ